MPIPTVVRSTDPGAPVLDGYHGSVYNVMKHALDLCGWTLEFDDPENFTCVFRNNPVTGSGCYVRIVDNLNHSMMQWAVFGIEVYEDMTDVNTGTGPHFSNEDQTLHNKSRWTTSQDVSWPWIIIGDDRTVYFSIDVDTSEGAGGFGDFDPLYPGLMSFQTYCDDFSTSSNTNGQNRLSQSLVRAIPSNILISRNPFSQMLQVVGVGYATCVPNLSASSNYSGIGGHEQNSYQSSEMRRFSFPAIITHPSTYGVLGKMRGVFLPHKRIDDLPFGSEYFSVDQTESKKFIVIQGGTSTTSAKYTGSIFLEIDRDWDDS